MNARPLSLGRPRWYDESPNAAWSGFQQVDSSGILDLRTSRNFVGLTGHPYPMNTITTQTSGLTLTQDYDATTPDTLETQVDYVQVWQK